MSHDKKYDYDLIVIGAGPGGYVAAIQASQSGMKTAIIEKNKIGGVCLNEGCIPTKALLNQTEIFNTIPQLRRHGMKIDSSDFNYKSIQQKAQKATMILSKGVEFLLKKNNIDIKINTAEIHSDHEIKLDDGSILSAQNILIATGSKPKDLPHIKINEETIISSSKALTLQTLPEKLLIIGGGAIGVEFAYIFNSFGVDITLIEAMGSILPLTDHETVSILHKALNKNNIQIKTDTTADKIEKSGSSITIHVSNKEKKESLIVDQILLAVGRSPDIENLNLEKHGIKSEKGFITVNDYYQTSIPSIYAIGDVINTPQLAHVASHEGIIAVEHMKEEKPEKMDPLMIPSAVYCEPQIASFGYSEETLKEKKITYEKSVFPYAGIGKATAIEKREGQIKILHEKNKILGVHIAGVNATELIHQLLLIYKGSLSPEQVRAIPFAHPTLSEGVLEAVRAIDGQPIHL